MSTKFALLIIFGKSIFFPMEKKGKIFGYSSARAEMTKRLCEEDLASEPSELRNFDAPALKKPEKESTDSEEGNGGTR